MSTTADVKPTQAPHEVIVRALRRGLEDQRRAGHRQDHAVPLVGHDIILALRDAGYIIVPRLAVDAALERQDAAA